MSCRSIPSDFKGTVGGQAACPRIRVPKGNMGDLCGKLSLKSGLQGRHHKSEILGETVDCHIGYSGQTQYHIIIRNKNTSSEVCTCPNSFPESLLIIGRHLLPFLILTATICPLFCIQKFLYC